MTNKMFNPKLEIIKYFDELIHQVDIDIEDALKNYNENQVLGDLECFEKKNREKITNNILSVFESSEIESYEYQTANLWTESTKVVDYLNQVRMRTIEELKKAQDETFEYYTLNSSRFNYLKEMKDEEKLEELKSQLFAEKFYFQLRLANNKNNPWIFNLFTFVTDFYISSSDIDYLKMLIYEGYSELEKFYFYLDKSVFDEKGLLFGLVYEYFNHNLAVLKCPNHLISVRKRDARNIKEINVPAYFREFKLNSSSIVWSKLERLTIPCKIDSGEFDFDKLSSIQYLNVKLISVKRFSVRNFPSLNHLVLETNYLDKTLSTQIFGYSSSSIKVLEIKSAFSDINLDDLVNLENLSISGELRDEFNFGLFKNFCTRLKELSIHIRNTGHEDISEAFYGHNFPNLVKLDITNGSFTKLEEELLERFPMLESLRLTGNDQLRLIDSDAFSSLTDLVNLNLSSNSIETINNRHFSELINLKCLDLSCNVIKFIEENAFLNLKNLTELDLNDNYLSLSTLHPKQFIGLEKLEYLNLSSNQIKYSDEFVQRIFDNNHIFRRVVL